jgi:uncharacterized membrane protein
MEVIPIDAGGSQWGACVKDGVATLECIPIVFKNVINWALIFAGVVALVIVILSGIKFITSKGDQKQVATAKRSLTFAILGLILIFLSFFIIKLIGYITGADCINYFGFNNCS